MVAIKTISNWDACWREFRNRTGGWCHANCQEKSDSSAALITSTCFWLGYEALHSLYLQFVSIYYTASFNKEWTELKAESVSNSSCRGLDDLQFVFQEALGSLPWTLKADEKQLNSFLLNLFSSKRLHIYRLKQVFFFLFLFFFLLSFWLGGNHFFLHVSRAL